MVKNLANKNEVESQKKDIAVCLVACLLIVVPSVISLFNGIIRSFVTLPLKIDTLFIYGLLLLLVLYAVKALLVRTSPLIYCIIAFLIFAYLISFMLNSYYLEHYLILGLNFLVYSLPWLVVAYAVRTHRLLKKYLYLSALIVLFSYIINFYVLKTIMIEHSYSQSYTYELLPVAIILGNRLFEKIKFFDVITFVSSIILMFSMGARGPIVCVMLFIALKILLMYKSKPKNAFIASSIIFSISVVIFFCFYEMLKYLLNLFQKMNLSTRTLSKLLEGSFLEDNARNVLFNHSIELIKEHPFTGVGMGNERILLANKMGKDNIMSETIGWYPHNFFLEILLHFGIFIGTAILIILVKIIFTTITKNSNKDAIDIICIFIGIGFFPLLMSGSYITSPYFFSLIGYCLFQYKNKKIIISK